MNICVECGALFEVPEHYVEKHGFTYGPYEEYDGCPKCSGNYTETYICGCCGKWIEGNYIKIGNDRYCEGCYIEYELGDE